MRKKNIFICVLVLFVTTIIIVILYTNFFSYVDLGLPSGTKWKSFNQRGYYTYSKAQKKYKNKLPTKAQYDNSSLTI